MFRALLTAISALAVALGAVAPALADPTVDDIKIVLVLDASASMNGPDPSGTTKLAAAKSALTSALDSLPEGAQVGLRVYGATVDGPGRTPAECADSQLVHPITPLDKPGLTAAIEGFAAVGETPIAYSLQEAAKDLGSEGKRHIILVSDGEERCVPDPCVAVQSIADAGIGLQIDTVGFGVDGAARNQLACIAEAGGGTFYDAKDADSLTSTLSKLSTRAARPFTVQGTPVEGTPTPEAAPVIGAGQYTDSVASSSQGDVHKYYRIQRTQPGSTIWANMLGRLPHVGTFEGMGRGGWDWKLTTPTGVECSSAWDLAQDNGRVGVIVGGSTYALPLDPRTSSPKADAVDCAEATELLLELRVGSGKTAQSADLEIRVLEEPPVANVAELPDGVATVPEDNSDELTSPASGTPVPVIGGSSFNDALTIEPGTYVTDVVPGELVFFKTKIDWGQGAIFAIDGPDPTFTPLHQLNSSFHYLNVLGNVYAPDLSQMDSQELWRWANYKGGTQLSGDADINEIPQVNYRNRWDSPRMYFNRSRGFAMAGEYFLAVGVGDELEAVRGVPLPIRFSLGVHGEVTGVPEYVDPAAEPSASAEAVAEETDEVGTPSDAPSPAHTPDAAETVATDAPVDDLPTDDGGSPLAIIGAALLGVGVLGAGSYAFLRRRR